MLENHVPRARGVGINTHLLLISSEKERALSSVCVCSAGKTGGSGQWGACWCEKAYESNVSQVILFNTQFPQGDYFLGKKYTIFQHIFFFKASWGEPGHVSAVHGL